MSQPQPSSAAETYERYFVPAMFVPWATILLRHASLRPGERVLDVACGTGIVARLAAPLVGSNGHVVALDLNQAMLAVARAQPAPSGATITWQEGNAMALPAPDRSFDAVLCQHGLQFIPDRARAVSEMRRVLVPGGRALVIVLQALAGHPLFEALITSVAHHLSLPISAVMTPFALCDADELRGLFISAGFDAHREDPLAGLKLTEADYAWVTRELMGVAQRHCDGRIVSSLEGGYALSALGRSVAEHVREFLGA